MVVVVQYIPSVIQHDLSGSGGLVRYIGFTLSAVTAITRITRVRTSVVIMTTSSTLSFEYGNLNEVRFNDEGVIICIAISAVAYAPFGMAARQVSELYPYGNFFAHRTRLFQTYRCIVRTRSTPGRIHLGEPPAHQPTIIGLVTQFGLGLPSDKHPRIKEMIAATRDEHYKEGLKNDTAENRISYLSQCLEILKKFIKKKKTPKCTH